MALQNPCRQENGKDLGGKPIKYGRLFDFEEIISTSGPVQGFFHSLHYGQYLFFLESSTYDLNRDRQPVHLFSVIVRVRSLGDSVELAELECLRQPVDRSVHVQNRDDATGVIELLRISHCSHSEVLGSGWIPG